MNRGHQTIFVKIAVESAVNIDNSFIGMKRISLLMLLNWLDFHRINLTFPEVNRVKSLKVYVTLKFLF